VRGAPIALAAVLALSGGTPAEAQNTDQPFIAWTKARAALDLGQPVRAGLAVRALADQCEAEGPQKSRLDWIRTAECWRWVGEKSLALGEFDFALGALTRAHAGYSEGIGAFNPLSGEVLYRIAEVHVAQADFDRARLALDRASSLAPALEPGAAAACRSGARALGRPEPKSCSVSLDADAPPLCSTTSCRAVFSSERLPGGRIYRGFMVNGRREGYGLEMSIDGRSIWRGSYAGGSLNGQAVFLSFDERLTQYYVGTWRNGRRHGYGEYRDVGGAHYSGQFEEGVEQGLGRLVAPGGGHYSGALVAGRFEGEGTWTEPDFLRFEGTWKGGERVSGVERYVDGVMEFRGRYARDAPRGSGPGRIFVSGREVFSGQLDPERGAGFGILLENDGATWAGQLVDGRRDGLGVRRNPDGSLTTGVWNEAGHLRAWTEADLAAAGD